MADTDADLDPGRVKDLLLEALERPPAERQAFVASACAGDERLAVRVGELLAAHARSAGLEVMAGAGEPAPAAPLALVGDYELLEELGRGAAGTVYRARQTSLGREVAIKVLRAGLLAGESDVRRFRREAEAAAALDHPSIVPVFDTGELEGHPFFSMKRIDGPSLDRVIGRFAGKPREAARLVATVARAVHHAHCRGVLHRDLKPSNILLDAGGAPHVVDFGIARPLGGARVTQTGWLCGTPAYMSPEQARGDRDVTVATDVWSLGCVLHELLAGDPPFGGDGVAEVLRRVQAEEPPRLVGVDQSLATIAATCLAKEPSRRYSSALALAEDLERWLDWRPIEARPITRLQRLRLLCRRSPVAASLGIAVALLLVVLAAGAGAASIVLRQRLDETSAANQRANQRLRASLVANARAERRSDLAGRREVGLGLLMQAAALEPGADVRDEAITTLTLPDLVTVASWKLGAGTPIGVAPGLATVAVSLPDGRVELRAAASGALRATVPASGEVAQGALFTHGGERLWLRRFDRVADARPALEVWDLGVDPPARLRARPVASTSFAHGPDDGLVALARVDGVVELIDADSGAVARELAATGTLAHGAFRPGGGALALAAGAGGQVQVVAVPDGEPLATLRLDAHAQSAEWSPDGELLIVGCFDQCGHVFETRTWTRRALLRGHEGEVVLAALLPGGLAATSAWDGTTRLWDVEVETELLRSRERLLAVDRSSRRMLLDGGADALQRGGTLSVAELVVDDVLRVLHGHHGKAPREVAESPDGRLLATCGEASWILWEASTGARHVEIPTGMVHSIAFEPDGSGVITSGADGVRRWPLRRGADGGPEVGAAELLVEGPCMRAALSSDGRWIGVVRGGGAWLRGRGGELVELGRHPGLDRVAFSPDGRWIAVGSWGGDGLHVWSTASGARAAHLAAGEPSAMGTFSPDGARLVVATYDELAVLRADTWTVERSFPREGPRRPPVPAAFSPDGALLALGIAPARVRLLRVDGFVTLADLEPAEPRSLFHMRFIDAGRRLAITTTSHRLLIWNLDAVFAELAQRGLAEAGALPARTTR